MENNNEIIIPLDIELAPSQQQPVGVKETFRTALV